MDRHERLLSLSVLIPALLLGSCAAPPPEPARVPSPGSSAGGAAAMAEPGGGSAAAIGDSVFFPPARADLTPDARRQLADWAAVLRRDRGADVMIVGHGDERGTRDYSLALGAERAHAVKTYLVALGVPAQQLTTTTYGLERPAAPGFTAEAEALDRRAVLSFPLVAAVPR